MSSETLSQLKYILVSGGVISGIGKGVITSSVGTLLKSMGLRVTAIKIDPYLNIDAGTFSPYEHGKEWTMHLLYCLVWQTLQLACHVLSTVIKERTICSCMYCLDLELHTLQILYLST